MAATQPKKKRASRVASPGAKRLTFTGVMAVPDGHDRLRVLLVDKYRDAYDASCATLRGAVPGKGGHYRLPYETWAVDAEGLRGACLVTVPAAHRKYWLEVADGLRGRDVRVEATVRPYSYEQGGEQITGAALDLALLEARGAS